MKNLIFYNWDKLFIDKKGNALEIIKAFESFIIFGVPKKFDGNSFLINVSGIIFSNTSLQHKLDYLYLASLRNYFDYKYCGDSSLYYYFSDLATERVKNNTRLYIKDEYIHFTYEETNGT